ncbi:MAG: LamB/YcsF family protein, partial [Candidatus Hodarchaeota archaeon]
LASRQLPGAVIHDPMIVAKRVIKMVSEGKIQAITGKEIEIGCIDTICVHGDTPGAVELAKNVRKELETQDVGIKLMPMRQSI